MPQGVAFAEALGALEAIAEPTRLRLAVLLAEAELTVTELTAILGQSQPRISRHLKLLVDAGVLERNREGAWAFFRIADGAAASFAKRILSDIDPRDHASLADRARLEEVRAQRAAQASSYFGQVAGDWDRIRKLHLSDDRVEAVLAEVIGRRRIETFLDIGTGTGRMLELFAKHAQRAVGVDLSAAMLSVARANLDRAGVRNVQLKQGDVYALPVEREAFDLVLIHQVLHFLDDPAKALREARRTLAPGGQLVVVDFAPHEEEFLRNEHAHRRLGFARDEISQMLEAMDLAVGEHRLLKHNENNKATLTVSVWFAQDMRRRVDGAIVETMREVA
jgi:ubiquinone/menaquinone biosynthesis C-methylase UbiE/DNA-binding transcriptional ArsR family regulator